VHLVARLIAGGFTLLDTQYVTEHLRSLGAIEVSRRRYRSQLDLALLHEGNFAALPLDRPVSGTEAMDILKSRS
jgi:leucyl/phenylalanyl-tRNA--protein transferase